ncbi:UbiH/UbiF/VisC/COQ6 family ubiquinone biosynthesis hydroxylase [Aliamphritea hakodatensis]|uniref:UbiH/UbiF/VisC/COQ6 family ubiquinone biosynthesis hydroxylase n=1 Tax=Aliamphritea hakodatensis TaxID=2895352 RepID=UPI0022FD78D0|nr:UbiH/UbiF/VisC/COQ6 family ubiquinone biosynthesis hydroxylase [Aliamphritea hakodatensis]
MKKYDVLIVGGGMVGASIACALGGSELSVGVIELRMPAPFDHSQAHDMRVSAISLASENILRNVGAWPGLQNKRLCPYRRLKTWEVDADRAATEFNSADIGEDHLGHIVENRVIQLGLLEQLRQCANVDLICPADITGIDYAAGASIITLADGQQVFGRLLIGADGAQSKVRSQVGIGVHSWDYEQHALVASVTTELPQQDITWQQFTPTGPLAFLPLSGHQGSLVWYNTPAEARRLLALSDEAFLAEAQSRFPDCLGGITGLLGRAAFPLRRQHAQQYVKEGVALVGDAAHTIHPLAGQGVNIGLLDAAALAEVLLDATRAGEDITGKEVLGRYENQRRNQNLLMMQVMDSFYRLFSNDHLPLKLLRNLGLGAAGKLGPARNRVMRFAMGLEGPMPELARR